MGIQQLGGFEPSMTQQSAKDECDINIIVDRAKRGADLSQLTRKPIWGDFIGLPSYRDALLLVNAGRDAFMSLDASVRKRFNNDPAMLLDFLNDESNREEAIKLGLIAQTPPTEVPAVEADKPLKSKSKKSVDVQDQPE